MSEPSTTAPDNAADDTNVIPPAPEATDLKTDAKSTDNLDETSKSTDTKTAADDDKKSTDDSKQSVSKDAPASFDDDLDNWIEKRGLTKPETDEQKQAYQDLRNSQREFTREQQAKKELGETIDDLAKDVKSDSVEDDDEDDPLEKRIKAMEAERDQERNTRLQSEFYIEKKVTEAEHKEILSLIREKVARPATKEGKIKALELWSHPDALPDLLDLAKARVAGTASSTVADEAARETREQIERESNAKSPSRNASQNAPSDKSEDDERYERFKARYNK